MDIWGAGVCGGVCGGGCLLLSLYFFLRYNMNRPRVYMYTYIIYLTFDISMDPYSIHLTDGAPIYPSPPSLNNLRHLRRCSNDNA